MKLWFEVDLVYKIILRKMMLFYILMYVESKFIEVFGKFEKIK